MTQKPINLVMVRRGAITIPDVPTQKLLTFIRKKALLGTDEISADGKKWVRVDRHYQLREFFLNADCQTKVSKEKSDLSGEFHFYEIPPDLENDLEEAVNLLRDINQ